MRKEDKALLVKDLCGRLPYGVKVACLQDTDHEWFDLGMIYPGETEVYLSAPPGPGYTNGFYRIEDIRPYLFPLSSMTEEQEAEYNEMYEENRYSWRNNIIDWFDKNKFDYRGLIPKGIAKDATGLGIY